MPKYNLVYPKKGELCGLEFIGISHLETAISGLETHSHENSFEIVYLHKGHQCYEVNGNIYHLKGGDVFITFPNEFHSTSTYPQERTTLCWFQINMSCNHFLGLDNASSSKLIDRLYRIGPRLFPGTPQFKTLISKIISLYNGNDELKLLKINHAVLSLLLLTIKCSEIPQSFQKSDDIQSVLDYIEENFRSTIHIQDLANLCCLSESRFKLKFKEQVGIPPNEYINLKKLEYAKHLMMTQNLNFTEISELCGFSSSYYFTRVFKKYSNQTPTEWKKNNILDCKKSS